MTELKENQKLERLITVYGIEGKVAVSITREGLSFRIPKTKKSVSISWSTVVGHCTTPTDVPSFLFGQPLSLLRHMAEETQKRKAKSKTGGK